MLWTGDQTHDVRNHESDKSYSATESHGHRRGKCGEPEEYDANSSDRYTKCVS